MSLAPSSSDSRGWKRLPNTHLYTRLEKNFIEQIDVTSLDVRKINMETPRSMDFWRKTMNQQQTELRTIMKSFTQHEKAIELFLNQHAMLHSAKMTQSTVWSYEDVIFKDIDEEIVRRVPKNKDHSVAWCIWHIARIEDVTMNILVADSQQILWQDNWLDQLNITSRDTGNQMSKEDIISLSSSIDIKKLRVYRLAVGQRTREIVRQLAPADLKMKVDRSRLNRLMDEGALVDEAVDIKKYWSRRDIAGLLLMPPTRHSLVHLNEALKLAK